jgi:xanthine dehydrogenase molybdenum-binding subunit
MTDKAHVRTTINGEKREFLSEPHQSLLYCLRETLGLTGTKSGCNDGNCGSCAVLLNGRLVNSCLVLGVEADGQDITTIEGVGSWAGLHPIQSALIEEDGLQCGFCTPGMVMAAKALLDGDPDPSDERIREWMAGNLCRCTGYDRIVRAVRAAATELARRGAPAPTDAKTRAKEPDSQPAIGTAPPRVGGIDKVMGKALFGADVSPVDALKGRILRSPHAHAVIKSIDVSAARALPGVWAVVTSDDLGKLVREVGSTTDDSDAYRYQADNVLAGKKVLYAGQAIAAVAASTEDIAEKALGQIKVDYDRLPPVIDVLAAACEDAPLLHDTMRTKTLAQEPEQASNIAKHIQQVLGDPAAGFEEADEIVERVFTTDTVHQAYIEPHSATAYWGPEGDVTVWTTTQGAFTIRSQLSTLFMYPQSKIRVIPTEIGGGFGGKIASYLEGPAAMLSRITARPVTMSMTRAEEFTSTGPSSGTNIKVRMGATREGRITAATAEMHYEAGAYPGGMIDMGASAMFSCYEIPNARIDGYDVVVNKPKSDTYRAPGATPAVFACEQTIAELAERLGMDPLEFRAINLSRKGSPKLDGSINPYTGSEQVLEAVKNHPHLTSDLGSPVDGHSRGRGIAFGFWGNWGAESSGIINVHTDGTVTLIMGSVDLTGTRTSMAMIAADTLGIPLDQVSAVMGDTGTVAYSEVSAGSRTTVATGRAVYDASLDAIDKMRHRAALLWELADESVEYTKGFFSMLDDPAQTISFSELAGMLPDTGGPLSGVGNVNVKEWGGAAGAHIADVDVDCSTGKVTVLRYSVVQDVGRAIHPEHVKGQMQGGAAQGIGWALYEGYQYDENGTMLNPGFLDYKLPTFLDLPPIETTIVENRYDKHPLGIRGVGEMPIVPASAAIGNAIRSAVGASMEALPMTPARILAKMGVL